MLVAMVDELFAVVAPRLWDAEQTSAPASNDVAPWVATPDTFMVASPAGINVAVNADSGNAPASMAEHSWGHHWPQQDMAMVEIEFAWDTASADTAEAPSEAASTAAHTMVTAGRTVSGHPLQYSPLQKFALSCPWGDIGRVFPRN